MTEVVVAPSTETTKAPVIVVDQGKVVGVNKYCDIGALLFEDCSSFTEKKD